MSKQIIKIGFIGAGSIGSLFGGYLASIQSSVYTPRVIFFCRKKHADTINKDGLKLTTNQGFQIIKNIKAYESPTELDIESLKLKSSPFVFDFLFLATKTYDIETAMKQYHNLIAESKWLVVLQNGIGNKEIIQKYCERHKIIRVVTSIGALLKEPGHIIHTGIGLTKIGLPFLESLDMVEEYFEDGQSDLNLLRKLLNSSGLETILSDDIIKDCWEKVFVNIGINPFGALTRLKNGKLLESEVIKRLMGEAVREALKVAELKNIKLVKKDYVALMYDVAVKTSENKNSMLQDVLKGKITEIDFINGRIVKYAKELGINVPINELLTHLIKGLEQSLN